MDDPAQLSEYGKILIIALIGILLVCATIFLAKVISPKKPNPIKLSTYECGEESLGTAWIQFNPRFYVIALVFLLFDVELIFVFPWATVFGQQELIQADSRWGWFTMVEMTLFLGVLILGLVYVWRRGDLEWIKPIHVTPSVQVNIPSEAYDALNSRSYAVRDYRDAETTAVDAVSADKVDVKPKIGFKPTFRKPGTTT
ncbi:NADH-quinone oxidoreductase subunit A [Sphingobacterium sp. SYP-B4668]|uniref:NADH-quinone oxidoreductase subunit A n=1 Tax=Sphingobacterium sp. SYP-B4668 TaxID=2996035 RepID=UPI0022DE727F|nr:NADH-quinone oxidoreductase subunit A [Sphingobacterium sp. SYP-B4668]